MKAIVPEVCTSVRPKPGFCIGNRNQVLNSVLASEPKLFFSKLKLFLPKFFKFCHVFPPLSGVKVFKSLKLNTALQKSKNL